MSARKQKVISRWFTQQSRDSVRLEEIERKDSEIVLRATGGNDILMMVSSNVRRLTKKQFREEVAKALVTAQQK